MKCKLPITHVETTVKTRAASCFCKAVLKYFPIYELCFDAEEKDEISIFLGLYGLPETIPNFTAFMETIGQAGIQADIDRVVPISVEDRECSDIVMEEGKATECVV